MLLIRDSGGKKTRTKVGRLAAGGSKGQLQAAATHRSPAHTPASAAASPDKVAGGPHSFLRNTFITYIHYPSILVEVVSSMSRLFLLSPKLTLSSACNKVQNWYRSGLNHENGPEKVQ